MLHGADMWPLVVSNRLLAILEEPAPGLELLVLSKSASILPTISSRLIGRYGARPQDATTLLRPSHQPGTHVRAQTLQEALFLLGSSHTGHDHSKLLHAAQNHV